MTRTKCWRYRAGERPHTVEVYERTPGGTIHVRMWDPSLRKHVKESLGHADQELARRYAEDEAAKLRDGAVAVVAAPSVGYVTMQYLVHRTPKKRSLAHQAEDRRRVDLWRKVLGVHRQLRTLGPAEWDSFITLRSSGAIDARGNPVKEKEREPVSPRTVDADLVFMVAVMNWATSWKIHGRPMLDRNPWGAQAPGVKRALERPKSLEVKQPVATFDRFLKVREASERVLMEVRKREPGAELVEVGRADYKYGEGPVNKWMKRSYLPELLDLVEATGRRITAICRLTYSDFIREGGKVTKVRWRPMKGAAAQTVPIGERARAAIERILTERPGIGDRPVFPSPRSKPGQEKAISRHLARDWLERAEDLAGVEHMDGGDFHPYRRAWATSRKHLPEADVMHVGGWTDRRSLQLSYQKADEETILAVVNEPRKLVEKKA